MRWRLFRDTHQGYGYYIFWSVRFFTGEGERNVVAIPSRLSVTMTIGFLQRYGLALKINGWPKILVPSLLGQLLGSLVATRFTLRGAGLPLAFTLAGLVYILLLNDWGDEAVDRIKRRMFPHSSGPKTLPDGLLPRGQVLRGGILALLLALGCAAALSSGGGRPWFLPGAGLGVLLFQAYSFAPCKLNYRGGGELLEMLGVGVLLPWLHAYGQAGVLWHPLYGYGGGFALLSLASALASGLSDEESDLVGGKRTFITLWGNDRVRKHIDHLLIFAGTAWLFVALERRESSPWWLMLAPLGCLWYFGWRLRQLSAEAVTRAFAAQSAYKKVLHHGIWVSTLVLALVLGLAERIFY